MYVPEHILRLYAQSRRLLLKVSSVLQSSYFSIEAYLFMQTNALVSGVVGT